MWGVVCAAVVALGVAALRPYLAIVPETAFSRGAQHLGRRDVRLEHHGFNQRFNIRTDSDRFAYDVLHPRTMGWLLRHPNAARLSFVIEGDWLYMQADGPFTLDELDGQMAALRDFADTIPSHVWSY